MLRFLPSLSHTHPLLPMALSAPTLPKLPSTLFPFSSSHHHHNLRHLPLHPSSPLPKNCRFKCSATEIPTAAEQPSSSSSSGDGRIWVPVVPLTALPKGERRIILQDQETILLLWYRDEIFAIENRSPAEGAYSEGLINAKLTQDGCIVCPSTDSTFDLKTGAIREWYPKNPVLRALTPALRTLFVYPVKVEDGNICISTRASGGATDAEIVFSGRTQPGVTATDVNVEEVRMVVDEGQLGFGFNRRNEVVNGKAAVIGLLLLLDIELLTGKGLLKGIGFLDFLYGATDVFN